MTKKSDKAKLIFLLLYFLILTVERVISLVTSFTNGHIFNALDWYMTVLTVLSIVVAYVFIIAKCRFNDADVFGKLAIAAGIILLGGMVHTEGSIPPIQFASYGMILVSMAIHTAQCVKQHGGAVIRWLSFGYIVAFSMSIPVVYQTGIELSWLFVPLEIVVSAGMVALFTVMLRWFYNGGGEYSFPALPLILALVGDAGVLVLRWNEEINFFVLIFIVVTAALFIAGKLASRSNAGK